MELIRAYYNENDPYVAQWLRNLIKAGHIADGDVDERSIIDVQANDLKRYTQCHFFAGIGGWSYALRLAGWKDGIPAWTGSCPCQPFSGAGRGKAADDKRHLWPAWFSLIAECQPSVIFGEQVEAAIGWGWIDVVFSDLESQGYTCGTAVLPACSVGAPHIRNRLWFVANSNKSRCDDSTEKKTREEKEVRRPPERNSAIFNVFNRVNSDGQGSQGRCERRNSANRWTTGKASLDVWSDIEWLQCTDGKSRPIKSSIFPLAPRIPTSMGRLRAYGNAIVPQVAARFIEAAMDSLPLEI
jgi:DNA (cytosine-5)-methyltransferase 1